MLVSIPVKVKHLDMHYVFKIKCDTDRNLIKCSASRQKLKNEEEFCIAIITVFERLMCMEEIFKQKFEEICNFSLG